METIRKSVEVQSSRSKKKSKKEKIKPSIGAYMRKQSFVPPENYAEIIMENMMLKKKIKKVDKKISRKKNKE